MSYIIKTSPIETSSDTITVEEKTMYDGHLIHHGAIAYVWFSEKQGGCGLVWRAVVEHVVHLSGTRTARVSLRLLSKATRMLTITDLKPERDNSSTTPLSSLSKKLYKHALHKIAHLSADEDVFLLGYFPRSQ